MTEYDLVIAGSGAGGGTVAERLAPLVRQGLRIALLESGPHYTRDYFTQREIEMMSLLWQNGAWPTKNGAVTLAAGRGVGGSTMMYTGVTFRLPDDVCEEWAVPGLTPDDLRPRFERLEKELSVAEPGPEMVNGNNRLFLEGCTRLGYKTETLKLNLNGCQQNGFCNLGCISGGKQSTLEVQIPRAVAAGVDLIPNCHVESVADRRLEVTVRPSPPGAHEGPLAPGSHVIQAGRVVLAAGMPGSPGILLRSGFGDRLPALGRYITLHPALTVSGLYPEPIKNYRGFPKTYFTPDFSRSHGYYVETAFYYPFVTTKHLGLWGRDLVETMKQYQNMMTVIILNHDRAREENCVRLGPEGRPELDYTLSEASKRALCHAQVTATRIFFAAGCHTAIMPCADRRVFRAGEVPDNALEDFIGMRNFREITVPIASAHPQGGCRMGLDPRSSVTSPEGRVHGTDWLYVADGSLFPESSHVNPYLTIMALADRVADSLRAELAS